MFSTECHVDLRWYSSQEGFNATANLNRCIELLLHITSPGNANVTLLNIVMGKYVEKSVEEGTRQQNGSKSGSSVHVLTLQQKKFQGRASATFS